MPAPSPGEPNQPRPSPNVFLSDTGSTDPPRVGRIDTHGTRPLDLTASHARLEAHVPLDASIGELLPEPVALAHGELASQRTADAPTAPEAPERPLRARARSVLPARLTIVQRIDHALRALLTAPPPAHAPELLRAADIAPPGEFTLPTRRSPAQRLRDAWAQSDYLRQLEDRIASPRLGRCVTVAVVSPKGGVGKTLITAILGALLAHLRRDRVIAVDANPDFGSLGRRLVPEHRIFMDDLLAGPLRAGPPSATQLDAQLGRGPDGLMIAAAPTDPARVAALDAAAYRTLFTALKDVAGVLVLDCGTGLDAAPARCALECADQIVLVTDAQPDTASLVWEAAQRLASGPPLLLVANKLDRASRLDLAALERSIPFAQGIVEVPHDRGGADQLLASGFSWARAPDGWGAPLRELAALLAADWPRLDAAT
jgi:MinD-like ATPase involved in chromosome partitioning or flagellar assembly